MTLFRVVLSTVDSPAKAAEMAEALVNERLVACVNILPEATSVYKWQGRLERSSESLMILKTHSDRLPALMERLRELHPYDVPEIVVCAVEQGSPEYLKWVADCLGV